MKSFQRIFWLAFVETALILVVAVWASWGSERAKMPPRPAFPLSPSTFVAIYGTEGYTPHYLFRYGLFGMTERMRQSDVLLLGPSHVELGLSAAQLSLDLTAALGRPVRVYNMGVGSGDNLSFDRTVFAANGIRDKAAIVDLYMPYGSQMSAFGLKVNTADTLRAYVIVGNLWLRAAQDWLADPVLPALSLNKPVLGPTRMLRLLTVRRWDTGDMVEMWKPEVGEIYEHSPDHWKDPFSQVDPRKTYHALDMSISQWMIDDLKARNIRAIYSMVPYDGDRPNEIPSIARPYVPIPSDHLTLLDTMHLNGSSREIATEALFRGLRDGGYLASWPFPPPSR
jgi:hypothetical protein